MKKIAIILMVFFGFYSDAQSYLGFNIGIDYAQIRAVGSIHPSVGDLFINDNDFSARGLFFGISGEQHLSKKISISVNFAYTKKDFGIQYGDIIYADKMSFRYYRSTIAGKWYPYKYAYFGTGLSLGYVSDVKIYYTNGEAVSYQHIENHKKYAVPFLFGLTYKNVLLEPYYLLGFNTEKQSNKKDIKPINSIGISLSYLIQVSKKRR